MSLNLWCLKFRSVQPVCFGLSAIPREKKNLPLVNEDFREEKYEEKQILMHLWSQKY